ncbi:MAG: recombinase family protein [Hyphomonadaceae bacterium]|nr:recombinase family protein [Hyphomonadaceae bacterium]
MKRRCAIYTRTSTEEGLSQDFNSLDAQTDACAAYVKSQIGEGWTLVGQAYSDGGYSGGTMERPAFQRLLADIKAGRVDVVVVYKVDRLTRSLSDFAKIMEVLDGAGASFVSVTQSFNTTTSMGRLTLNVLLSFAQFEREVTGERIRDKFAASKAKGMWMGGSPPLGYDASGRTLVIHEAEASSVRYIFSRFIELGSVLALVGDLKNRNILSKRWTSAKGVAHGGRPITRGALYAVLTNPIYRGVIRHKGKEYPGQHPAIIDQQTWAAAQAMMAPPGSRASPTQPEGLLLGKLFDDAGHAMAPTSTNKRSRRYRYYVSQPALRGAKNRAGSLWRIATSNLDEAVIGETIPLLSAHWMRDSPPSERVTRALHRVELSARSLKLELRIDAIDPLPINALPPTRAPQWSGDRVRVQCHISLAKPRGASAILRAGVGQTAKPEKSLIRAVAMAHVWAARLEAGQPKSIAALAKAEGLCILHTAKLLPLAFLAPDLVELILTGRQPPALTLTSLLAEPLPFTWAEQRARFEALAAI